MPDKLGKRPIEATDKGDKSSQAGSSLTSEQKLEKMHATAKRDQEMWQTSQRITQERLVGSSPSAAEHPPESAQGTEVSSSSTAFTNYKKYLHAQDAILKERSKSQKRASELGFARYEDLKDVKEQGLQTGDQATHRTIAGSSSDTREQWTPAQYSGTIGTLRMVQAIRRKDFATVIKYYKEGTPIRQTLENLRDMIEKKPGFTRSTNTDAFVKAWDDAAIASDDNTKREMQGIIAETESAVNSGARHLNF